MMSSILRRRKPRNNQATVAELTEEDGTQADRPKKKAKKAKLATKRAIPQPFAELNEKILKDFVQATCSLGVKSICEEFLTIRAETQPCNKPKTGHESHPDRNRYKDVYCIDETRVILKYPDDDAQNDYIHANYVRFNNTCKFICTQGPTEKTIEDFWRLVWQEKSPCLLMLCNLMEMGKKKCELYWPDTMDKPLVTASGRWTIKATDVGREMEQNMILTKLVITDEKGATHNVDHWQWKAWPDRGVPEIPMATFRLLLRLKNQSPIIVHCSAGIGRTGTIVGLDIAYQKMCTGEKVSLNQIVRDIRNQRHGSVQTDAQYLYMHRVLIALAENRKVNLPEMAAFIADYDRVIATKGS